MLEYAKVEDGLYLESSIRPANTSTGIAQLAWFTWSTSYTIAPGDCAPRDMLEHDWARPSHDIAGERCAAVYRC